MKATITADGTLVVTPESELDAFALGQWSKTNLADWFSAPAKQLKIMIDCSRYPAAIDPLFVPMGLPR